MGTSHSLVPPIIRPRVAFSHRDASPGTLTLGLACEPQPAAAESVSDAGERCHVGVTETFQTPPWPSEDKQATQATCVCVYSAHSESGVSCP